MLKNYLNFTCRNLWANKAYSAINIIGLAVSLTASILLLLWINDELSFNRFHKKADRIYKVSAQFKQETKDMIWEGMPGPVATTAKTDAAGVEDACRTREYYEITLLQYKDKRFDKIKGLAADPSFFRMFDFPLISGSIKQPYTDDLSIVISESIAHKFFGNDEPIGKSLTGDDKKTYHVTGVMRDIPTNSSIRCDVVFAFDILKRNYNGKGYWKSLDSDWGNYNYDTYLLVNASTNLKNLAVRLKEILGTNHKELGADYLKTISYLLLPVSKIHLYSPDGTEAGMKSVRIFFIIACIILLIACINYVNLVTARASKRSKEISLRKIIGAGKSSLFRQFLGEALILFLISIVIATILIYLLMPVYNELSGKELIFNLFSGSVLGIYAITLIITMLFAGIYPAITLSSFKPLEAMKGKISGMGSKATFRRVLVVIQFTFSIILIISTVVITRQLKYIREMNLGYDKENIITFSGLRAMSDHFDAVKQELLKQPGILSISASGDNISSVNASTSDADWDGKTTAQASFVINQLAVEKDIFKTLNLKLNGEGFIGTPIDSNRFIVNETAVKAMGIKYPIGKRFTFHDKKGTIVGVVKDFHFKDLHSKIEPLIMFYNPWWRNQMYIKTTAKDASQAVAAISAIWKKYNPDYTFDYHFVDDDFERTYKTDIRVGSLFNYFSLITIFISCLGLFGLVSFTAESKVKEIGVRKVLGASINSIVAMLSKDFLKLIIIAAAIAFPASWWLLKKMLEDYAYRTDISWWMFALAAVITTVIALVTISTQAIKAAVANPVKSLRSE